METSTEICDKKYWKKFKSYYVVWKQKIAQANKSFAKRLNRTM